MVPCLIMSGIYCGVILAEDTSYCIMDRPSGYWGTHVLLVVSHFEGQDDIVEL